ncbi:hypothetical protein G6O44_25590 [Salmonella enterica subsp. enterica serovar Enteritidis]|nr:hypothetical protein [Salmonella enterica subsp. enterica serovar Enteritidis]
MCRPDGHATATVARRGLLGSRPDRAPTRVRSPRDDVAMENGCAFLTLKTIGVWCDQM